MSTIIRHDLRDQTSPQSFLSADRLCAKQHTHGQLARQRAKQLHGRGGAEQTDPAAEGKCSSMDDENGGGGGGEVSDE